MKKVLIGFLLIFSMQIIMSQEIAISYGEELNSMPLPSDVQIEKLFESLNLPEEQKQQIYIQAREQAQDIYRNQDSEALKKHYQQALKTMQQTGISLEGILPEVQKTDKNIEAQEPKMPDRPQNQEDLPLLFDKDFGLFGKNQTREKKYSKHPPLMGENAGPIGENMYGGPKKYAKHAPLTRRSNY